MFKQIIVWLRLNSSTLKSLCVTLLLSLSFNLQGAHGSSAQTLSYRSPSIHSLEQQPPPSKITAQELAGSTLAPGQPVEREISGGQKHSYQLKLVNGQYACLIVEQQGIDVVVQLLGDDGKQIAEFDSDPRIQGSEKVEIVAEAARTYTLDVKAKQNTASPGRYEIRVTELRVATDRDRSLDEARKLTIESNRLLGGNKTEDARRVAERVLAIREEVLGPDHPEVARALNRLARINYILDDDTKAEPQYKRAIAIGEKMLGPDHPDLATYLIGLANLYYKEELYARANPLYLRALEIKEKVYGPDHPEVGRVANLLANSYGDSHDFAQEELFYQRALAIAEKSFGPNHPTYAGTLGNLGVSYMSRGDYGAAEQMFLRALEIFEKNGKDRRNLGPLFMSMGSLYSEEGEYAKAEIFFQRFLGLLDKESPDKLDLTIALNNLGSVYIGQGEYAKAETTLQRALTIREEVFGPESIQVASVLTNLGNLYRAQGDYDKAAPSYRRALTILEKALGTDSPNLIECLQGLAMLYRAKGDSTQSISYQIRINDLLERNVTHNLAAGSERQKLAYLASLSENADRTLSLHIQMAPDNSDARTLAVTSVLQRKGRVLDSMANNLAALRRRLNAEDHSLLDRLSETTTQLANLVLNGPQRVSLTEHQNKIKVLEEQKEKLETDISHRSSGFYQVSQPVTLAAVQATVPAAAALIEFDVYRPFNPKAKDKNQTFGEPRYVAYIVRRQGEVQFSELGDIRSIDDAVHQLRRALRDPSRGDVRSLARTVDEKIFQPVRALLGTTTQLLVSPDGELNLIPFEALVDEHGKYLIEHYSFTYLTSGRDLLRLQVRRESKGAPTVVADPAFGAPTLKASSDRAESKSSGNVSAKPQVDYSQIFFGPLPGVSEEVRALKELLPQATFFTKEQATKAALKSLSGPSILHIATHGFFLQDEQQATAENRAAAQAKDRTRLGKLVARVDNPLLRSGLALAGANQSSNGNTDGILTALEVAGLDLWGTKLVVLSACDTGVGEVKNGDGVYGLRRALVLAGAESQVMSLWAVSDRSTRDLIVGYYKRLLQGAGRGEALRQAQLQMLNDKARRHPYYWASFIQTGEWANLKGKR